MNNSKQIFFSTIELFSTLTEQQTAKIASHFHLQIRARNELLFLEGDKCQAFYIVSAGRVRLYEASLNGKEQTLLIKHPRDFFDVAALIDNLPHPLSAVTMSDVRLYTTSKTEMLHLVRQYPAIAEKLMPYMSRMLRQLDALVGDLSFNGVAARLGRLILEHVNAEGVTTPNGIYLPWGLTHREIALLIGTAREVVSRLLHQLEDEGVIKSNRGQLIIKNLPRLQKETHLQH